MEKDEVSRNKGFTFLGQSPLFVSCTEISLQAFSKSPSLLPCIGENAKKEGKEPWYKEQTQLFYVITWPSVKVDSEKESSKYAYRVQTRQGHGGPKYEMPEPHTLGSTCE